MPIIETLTFGLGSIVAKEVVKALLGKDSALVDVAGVLVDVLKGQDEKTRADRKKAREITTLSENIVRQTLALFDNEGGAQSDDDRRRIKAEVAATIASNPLTSDVIISHNNDAELIARDMLARREEQVAHARFSPREHSLYERMVTECVRGMCNIITSVDSFVPRMLGEAMHRQEAFQDYIIEALVNRLEQERDEVYARSARVFAAQYYKLLIQQFDKFELFGVPDVQDQVGTQRRLSEVYISLSASENMRDKELIRDREHLPERTSRQCSIERAVALSPRLVITGAAGGGKSTLLKYLAVKTVSEDLPTELMVLRKSVPFLLRLRHFPDHAFPRVEDWLKTEFQFLPDPPASWILRQLESGYAMVMVDGVDELPQARRDAMLEALKQLVTLYPAARYVVTSRPAALQDWPAWRDWIVSEGFTHMAIDPMSDEQRTVLVTRWFTEYRRCVLDIDTSRRLSGMDKRLNDLIDRRTPLQNLANNPLMCAMVCALYETYGDSLPQRRTDLYDKCIDMALTLRDERRGVPSARDYRLILDRRALLQHVSAWMMPIVQDEQTSVDRERVVGQMDHWIKERRLPGASGADMCKFYIERAELLHEPLVGKIEFVHRTFQEYLAARQLCEDDRLEELFPRLADARWREVIVLAAGIANRTQRSKLLREASVADALALQEKLVFMLDCMEAASDKLTQIQREETISTLAGIANLLELDLTFTGVSDVSALAGLTNLQQLDLSSTGVSDVSALAALANLCTLDLSSSGVSDVSALAALANLRTLDLSSTGVSDVSALAGLTNLQHLYLRNTGLSDISALAGLTNLRQLYLSNTGVSDVSALAGLTNLRQLNLINTDVSDVSALAGLTNLQVLFTSHVMGGLAMLTNLQRLVLRGRDIGDISALAGLANLRQLDLSNTGVSDVSMLAGLTNLQVLRIDHIVSGRAMLTNLQRLVLDGSDIGDVSVLAGLTNLQQLNLSRTDVSDVGALAGLINLQQLNLSNTGVSDVSALAGLTNLRQLNLSNTGVSDVSALAGLAHLQVLVTSHVMGGLAMLTNLQHLVLRGSDIGDVSALAGLPNLRQLDLSNSGVSDMSMLAGLTNLQELNLSNTDVKDMSVLAGLTNLQVLGIDHIVSGLAMLANLQRLVLHGSDIGDISAIAGLPNLRQLDLSNTDVKDISVLAGLTNLQVLDLDHIVSGLAMLTNLQRLVLRGSDIGDISAIAGLPNLRQLDLSNTDVSDVSALAGLTNLTVLDVRGAPLRDMMPLTHLRTLCMLAVSPEQWSPANEATIRSKLPELVVFVRDSYEFIAEFNET